MSVSTTSPNTTSSQSTICSTNNNTSSMERPIRPMTRSMTTKTAPTCPALNDLASTLPTPSPTREPSLETSSTTPPSPITQQHSANATPVATMNGDSRPKIYLRLRISPETRARWEEEDRQRERGELLGGEKGKRRAEKERREKEKERKERKLIKRMGRRLLELAMVLDETALTDRSSEGRRLRLRG